MNEGILRYICVVGMVIKVSDSSSSWFEEILHLEKGWTGDEDNVKG